MSKEKADNIQWTRAKRGLGGTVFVLVLLLLTFGNVLGIFSTDIPIQSIIASTDSLNSNALIGKASVNSIKKESNNLNSVAHTSMSSSSVAKDGTVIEYDPEKNFKQIINTSPAVLFIRSSEYESNILRKLLTRDYEITPELAIVDLDKHGHDVLLERHILSHKIKSTKVEVLKSTSVKQAKAPYLFINGHSLINNGIADDILKFHEKGQLLTKLKAFAGENIVFNKRDLPSNS